MAAHMLDTSNAFVESDLDKSNCMGIPEGMQDLDPEVRTNGVGTEEVAIWPEAVQGLMALKDQPILDWVLNKLPQTQGSSIIL